MLKWAVIPFLILGILGAFLVKHEAVCQWMIDKATALEAPTDGPEFIKMKFTASQKPFFVAKYDEPLEWRLRAMKYAMIMTNTALVVKCADQILELHKDGPMWDDPRVAEAAFMKAKALDQGNDPEATKAAYKYFSDNWADNPKAPEAQARFNEIDGIHR